MKSTSRTAHLVPALASGLALAGFASGAAAEEGGCTLRGDAVMKSTAKLYLEATGGSAYARFTGAMVTIQASEFPSARAGRAKVALAGFGLVGYVDAKDLPVFTTRDVPVYQGHVWIAAHRDVVVTGAAPGKLQVERQVYFPMNQTFSAWATCDALAFTQQVASGWTPPGDARGYVAKESLDLFSGPDGTNVATLFPAADASGILLWSSQRQGPWAHVEFHGDVILDAWAKTQSLKVLPRGETMDQLYPPTLRRGKPTLKLATEPKVVTKDAELTLRSQASESAPAVGKIAPGTELYVLDLVAGWASVLPKSLSIAPDGENQFWVRGAELGL